MRAEPKLTFDDNLNLTHDFDGSACRQRSRKVCINVRVTEADWKLNSAQEKSEIRSKFLTSKKKCQNKIVFIIYFGLVSTFYESKRLSLIFNKIKMFAQNLNLYLIYRKKI